MSNGGFNTVMVFDTSSGSAIATISGISKPRSIAVSPAGDRVYVTSPDTIFVIDARTNTVTTSFSLGTAYPNYLVMGHDGSRLYASCQADSQVLEVIDAAGGSVTASIPITSGTAQLAIDQSGGRVYAAGIDVNVINTLTDLAITTVPLGQAVTVGVVPGGRVYAAGQDGTVAVIDPMTNSVVADIPTNGQPVAMAVA